MLRLGETGKLIKLPDVAFRCRVCNYEYIIYDDGSSIELRSAWNRKIIAHLVACTASQKSVDRY